MQLGTEPECGLGDEFSEVRAILATLKAMASTNTVVSIFDHHAVSIAGMETYAANYPFNWPSSVGVAFSSSPAVPRGRCGSFSPCPIPNCKWWKVAGTLPAGRSGRSPGSSGSTGRRSSTCTSFLRGAGTRGWQNCSASKAYSCTTTFLACARAGSGEPGAGSRTSCSPLPAPRSRSPLAAMETSGK